jgi:hypothetical protein
LRLHIPESGTLGVMSSARRATSIDPIKALWRIDVSPLAAISTASQPATTFRLRPSSG